VLSDCLEDNHYENVELVKVKSFRDAYANRWYLYRDYLKEHKQIDYVWCIDGSDVEMINNPFNEMTIGKIYVGSEEQVVGCNWLKRTTVTPVLQSFIITSRKRKLLNAGLLGGSRKDILDFCTNMCKLYDTVCNEEEGDMTIFNYLAYMHYRSQIEFGSHINTKFKGYEVNNKFAWFRHK